VELIAKVMDREVEVVTDEERIRPQKSEVERLLADNAKAREIAGWSPAYAGRSGLEQGLRKTVEWFMEPENARRYKENIYNV
jgi:nucleoside-diphosphate-sugar epimerase